MSRIFEKLITMLLLIVISLNFIFPNFAIADASASGEAAVSTDQSIYTDAQYGIGSGGVANTVFGFLTYIPKLTMLVPGLISNAILSLIANVGSNETFEFVTLEDILFNKIPLTDVNIFEDTTAPDIDGNTVEVSDVLKNIRENVAGWYVAFRNLAIVVSFLVLLYVGIRMAFDNFGERKAKYKQMIKDWVVCLCIVLMLHLFIVAILMINAEAVKMLTPSELKDGQSYIQDLFIWAFDLAAVKSWGAAIVYSILGIISFTFLVIYIKRMLMTCFLVMIAPIVSVFYSLDKVGDGKSKILAAWVKEFSYNVLIQPFHCIVYMVFVGSAMNTLYESGNTGFNLKYVIIAVTCTICIFIGEKIIRTIFGFTKSKSVASKLFNAAMITTVVNDIKKLSNMRRGDEEDDDEEGTPALMPNGMATADVISGGLARTNLKEAPVRSRSFYRW